MRLVDGVIYEDFGAILDAAGEELPPGFEGKRWMKLDMSQFLKDMRKTAAGGTDPGSVTGSLQYLRGVDPDAIDDLGHDDVRGVDTTHYHAEVDMKEVAKQLDDAHVSATTKRAFDQALRAYGDDTTVPVDVWIDGNGRVRRQEFDVPMPVPGGSSTAKAKMRMEMYDFGVDVEATAPPADEVADLRDLLAAESSAGA
jgi:hypothetical protein